MMQQTLDYGIMLFTYMLSGSFVGSLMRIGYSARRHPEINVSYSLAGCFVSSFLYLNILQLLLAWSTYWNDAVVFNPIMTYILVVLVFLSLSSSYGMTMLFGDFFDSSDRYRNERVNKRIRDKLNYNTPLSREEERLVEERNIQKVQVSSDT